MMREIFIGLIRLYQIAFSPLFLRRCRFEPTCSHYASEAIARYGARKGILLALYRLVKCHPLHPGGFDPVR